MAVVELEPARRLVLRGGPAGRPAAAGDYFRGGLAASWAFVLEPLAAERTRLTVRLRADWQPSIAASLFQPLLLRPAQRSDGARDAARHPGSLRAEPCHDARMTDSTARARRHLHLSVEERVARGKAARPGAEVEPREVGAGGGPARPDRAARGAGREPGARARSDPPRADARLPVHVLPRRRADHGGRPRADARGSGINVQLCGDAHLSNFGVFGSPERQLLFDINDFDETLPGPWEWDVKRLAASFEVAGRDLGFAPADRRDDRHGLRPRVPLPDAARPRACARSTRGTTTWTSDAGHGLVPGRGEREAARQEGGRSRRPRTSRRRGPATTSACFAKLAGEIDGELRIVADPPLIVPIEDLIAPARRASEIDRLDAQADRVVPAHARAPPPPDRGVRVRPRGAQGRRRRQRRHAGLDPPLRRPRRQTTPCSCRRRRRRPRCSSGSSARASTPTTASASSPASA